MRAIYKCLLLTIILCSVKAAKDDLKDLSVQIETLKTLHKTEVLQMKKDIADLKQYQALYTASNQKVHNEEAAFRWARSSMHELRVKIKEVAKTIENSVLLEQLSTIRNELKQALMETSELARMARCQVARLDKVKNSVTRVKYDNNELRTMITDLRSHMGKITSEIKDKQMSELDQSYNEVNTDNDDEPVHAHRLRHSKMMHTQIARLSRNQDQLDRYQQNLQTQMLDIQRRLDRFEEPNWNLLSAKVEFQELATKLIRDDLKNVTQKVSDFDKVHATVLELREDVENIENKADKIMPEFRKEISKLDVGFAQVNAQTSYVKEDLENLRQSVKAIAVSVSNTIDRAENDRVTIKKINDTIVDLETRTKQHFFRLNDHILKSEANHAESNFTELIPLPALMDEVKELLPVQRQYEDLVSQLPKDCSSISGSAGKYLIHPGSIPVDTWCENENTFIQRRYNGTTDFNRKFLDYVHGFGDPESEFWLGLDAMHELTYDNCSSMRIDMTDIYGGSWYAQYEHFTVGSGDTGYVLQVSGFTGNASDAFEYQNHMEFSAIDRDRDISNTHCAGNYEGGWWFSHCQHVNINGKYTLGLTWFDSLRNEWIAVATSEMKVFRRKGCS